MTQCGFLQQSYNNCVLTLPSLLLWQFQLTFQHVHNQAGDNPEMHALFYFFARLYQTVVTGIFVFDGPGQPSVKHGKKVCGPLNWMLPKMKAFIGAFGFHWYEVDIISLTP